MKFDTVGLPGQVAKREQAARLTLQIFDQQLVTHAVQCTRHQPVPVCHERTVTEVVPTQIFQVVGHGIGVSKQALVHGITGIHRPACHVNDFRPGQCFMNQAAIQKVQRQFVDKSRFSTPSRQHTI